MNGVQFHIKFLKICLAQPAGLVALHGIGRFGGSAVAVKGELACFDNAAIYSESTARPTRRRGASCRFRGEHLLTKFAASSVVATGDWDRWSRRLAALVVLGVGLMVLAMAWPRLQASVHYLPVDSAIKRYYSSGEIPSVQLPALIERTEQSILRYRHYRYLDGLSFLLYLQAADTSNPRDLRWSALKASLQAAEAAVQKAPAKPATWLRIARVRSILGQGDQSVVPPLKMSILSGRVEPRLLMPRIELGLGYLQALDEESLSLLRDQLLLVWQVSPRSLVNALKQERIALEQVEWLLGARGAGMLTELKSRLQ